jgi:hypothetical protein
MLKRDQRVVKILRIGGFETATIETVASVKRNVAEIVDSSLRFNAVTMREIDPSGLGTCWLVPFDGGEIERWQL